MNRRTTAKRCVTRIAVPYYGQLVRPCVGVEKIYFVVEVHPNLPEPRHVAMRVWNPDEVPELPVWLRKKGVSGVICSDTTLRCRYDFSGEGIWVAGGQKGDVTEIIRRWAATPDRESLYLTRPGPEKAEDGGRKLFQVARPALAGI